MRGSAGRSAAVGIGPVVVAVNRRAFLRWVGVGGAGGLAGCGGGPDPTPTPSATAPPTRTDTATATALPERLADEWSGFQHDGAHSGYNPATAVPPAAPAVRWQFELPQLPAQPVVADGTVFLAADMVYALDADSGRLQWTVEPRLPATPTWLNTPTLAGERLLVPAMGGDGRNYLYAIDAGRGQVLWRYEDGTHSLPSPFGAVATDSTLVHYGVNLVGLDPATGVEQWGAPNLLQESIETRAWPPAHRDGTLYLPTTATSGPTSASDDWDGGVTALDAASGEVAWASRGASNPDGIVLDDVRAGPVLAGDTVIAGEAAGTWFGLDAASGEERWRFVQEYRGERRPVTPGIAPAVAGGVAYLPITDATMDFSGAPGKLRAFDVATGDVRWERDVGPTLGRPAVAGDYVLLARRPTELEFDKDVDEASRLVALRRSDGSTAWKVPLAGTHAFGSGLAVADGRIYVGAGDGLYCYE